MTNFIIKAALAAAIAVTGFAATSQANAAQVDVIIRTPHVVRKPVIVVRPAVVRPRVVVVRPAPVVIVRPAPVVVVRGSCAPGLALQKAANQGFNRVAISKIGHNRVIVSGKVRGVWANVAFANVRGCPRL